MRHSPFPGLELMTYGEMAVWTGTRDALVLARVCRTEWFPTSLRHDSRGRTCHRYKVDTKQYGTVRLSLSCSYYSEKHKPAGCLHWTVWLPLDSVDALLPSKVRRIHRDSTMRDWLRELVAQ